MKIKDNQPITDEQIDELNYSELMMAYLVAKTTPEQQQRIVTRLRSMKPVVA